MGDQGRAVIVLTGGDPVDPAIAPNLPGGALVVAADSGLAQAVRLGLKVHLAVGDFDSVEPETLVAAAAQGCRIERHPVAKDQTDLELGLLAARSLGAEAVVVVGGSGGRLDHLLANALALAGPALVGVAVEAWMGPARLHVARPDLPVVLDGRSGELVTLLALGGPAREVRTEGLRYPLVADELRPGSTRGVSNEMVDGVARIALGGGVLLVVRPTAGLADGATSPSGLPSAPAP